MFDILIRVLQVQLDHQDLLVHQEWYAKCLKEMTIH